MPILEERHDFAHPVGDDGAWSESYYFNAYAPGADAGCFARIAVRPNAGAMDALLGLWLPDGGGLLHAERRQEGMVDGLLEVGPLRFELLEPMRRWRCSGAGTLPDGRDVTLDAEFEALTPAIGVDRAGDETTDPARAAARATLAAGHLEQAGRWRGELVVAGVVSSLDDARGSRDKSWGPRRADGTGSMTMWRWFSVNVGDDTHLGGVRIGTPAGDVHRGWIWTEGEATSIRAWHVVTTAVAPDGLTHEALEVVARDRRGREHRLAGEVLHAERVGRDDARVVVVEGLTRWRLDGRTGYGVSEYAHVMGDDGHPVVPVTAG